ncbi:MAG: helix-turn-helix transcriptional regulator [Bacteroidales bacterium]|nr:helix-turn-helix transcriptional regulator [Bacteroidales bacterium]MBQ2838503.1 helix-turn-helix transcriptional regulator [Muribaculaceae bacterium]
MAKIDDFFIPDNSVAIISDASYEGIQHTIDEIEAFSRLTYKSVYIIDYYKRNFLFVAKNPLFLCGHTPEEVTELGYNFYIENVPPEDLKFLLEINVKGFEFLKEIPAKEKKEYTISYCFNIINKQSKKKQLINHQITPLRLTKSGEIWLALCVASIPSNGTVGEIIMSRNGANTQWRYSREGKRWKEEPRFELNENELNVLKFSAMGYTMNEIAELVHRSFDTVKVYRKNIFEKLGAENISEAINIAMNYRLI